MSDDKQEIRFRTPAQALGFAQLYHVATLDPEISDAAMRTYLVYIMPAQQKRELLALNDRPLALLEASP